MSKNEELPDSMFLVSVPGDENQPTETLGFSRTPTVLLTFAANRFTRSAARLYQEQFGIGAMDWRMLVMLTRAPGSSVAAASKTIGIDKAAVSRSLKRLQDADLAEATCQSSDPRRKEWTLTPKGQKLHSEILAVALDRQKKLLEGFSAKEVDLFNDFLRRFLENLDVLNEATD